MPSERSQDGGELPNRPERSGSGEVNGSEAATEASADSRQTFRERGNGMPEGFGAEPEARQDNAQAWIYMAVSAAALIAALCFVMKSKLCR